MKIRRLKRKVQGKEYDLYRIFLRKKEALKLLEVGNEFEIEDIDPKGWIILKVMKAASNPNEYSNRRFKTSFDVYGGQSRWNRFRQILNHKGLTECHFFNDVIDMVLARDEHSLHLGDIYYQNVWVGKPGSTEKVLLMKRVVKE